MSTEVFDKHGRRRKLRRGEILRDGEHIVVANLMMMDAATEHLSLSDHRPGQRCCSTADAILLAAGREERECRLADAWRPPGSAPETPTTDAAATRVEREQRLCSAWTRGGRA